MHDVTLIAFDYDGTLATEGSVSPQTIGALKAILDSGRRLILATGRQLNDLLEVFPEVSLFEWVIAENGAVIYETATGKSELVGSPPPGEFLRLLKEQGVTPVATGQVILATKSFHVAELKSLIDKMNLEHQVILNKDSAMVLPKAVNKGTGLRSVLQRLGIDREEVLSAGDGENDGDLFRESGIRVAVSNAVPELKEMADWVTTGAAGSGVEELSESLVRTRCDSK